MKDILLVYSGGLDSSSALHIHKNRIALAVSFNYGSRHNDREIQMAKLNCERLGIEHKVIDLEDVFLNMQSALLGDSPIPHGHYEAETMKSTVVPFRNGIMLSIAAGMADSANITQVMLASHAGDNAVYPDCRQNFNCAMDEAINFGTDGKVNIKIPFAKITKKELVDLGMAHGLVPEQTYSCYEGGVNHCGKCSTCVERLWALDGHIDGTWYDDAVSWKEVLNEAK